MKNTEENKEKVIQYLYGNLSESERDDFEELIFTDEKIGLLVDDVENDLIDEYVRGELEFDQKREFESKYLNTESRHERVALARTLQTELFGDKKEKIVLTQAQSGGIWQSLKGFLRAPNLALASGLAVILLLILFGGIWLVSQTDKEKNLADGGNENTQEKVPEIKKELPEEDQSTPAETPSKEQNTNANRSNENNKKEIDLPAVNVNKKPNFDKRRSTSKSPQKKPATKPIEKKQKDTKKPKTVVRRPSVFTASLFPPLRSSQTPVLKIPSEAKNVRLQLFDDFGQNFEKFVINLNDGGGNSVWRQEIKATKTKQKSIVVSLPNNKLNDGNYELALSGVTGEGEIEEINFYNFVVKKQ